VWLDPGYVGIGLTIAVLLVCAVSFMRLRWPGLLFWSGGVLGAMLGQVHALWVAIDASWFVLWTDVAIGAVLGMVAGGILADWWHTRQVVRARSEVPRGDGEPEIAVAPRRPLDDLAVGVEDYPVYEAEVG
jgi:hypothetical protein